MHTSKSRQKSFKNLKDAENMKGTCLSSKQGESVHENKIASNIIHTEKETEILKYLCR